jgi:pimeloyl-ACP methyl ester carboxylesterase
MIFHPRRDSTPLRDDGRVKDLSFSMDDGATIGGRLYISRRTDPVLLFFHGNGEIASDYDDIAPLFVEREVNFLVADYRGYGRSTGSPTLTAMVRDSLEVFREAREQWTRLGFSGPIWVMGRSLGSTSAIHVARSFGDFVAGLIVESGFADTVGLLGRVGIPVQRIALPGEWIRFNEVGIRQVFLPTLLIHGERDEIIPVADGRALFQAAGAPQKELLIIPGAGHNDLFWVGMVQYMAAIHRFVRGGPDGGA